MLLCAQIPPHRYRQWAPTLLAGSLMLLLLVLIAGHIGKGAQRWIHIGGMNFEPSEFMKIALPMGLAWFLHRHSLPPSWQHLGLCCLIIGIPVVLVAIQPDLGTAILLLCVSIAVLFLAGVSTRIFASAIGLGLAALPVLWHFMHPYQRQRVRTFLNPEADPLGAGYHIIQSKIAIGSGGILGKGWLQGTQAHYKFLPEHATDFIFALNGEEFGLLGGLVIIVLSVLITLRLLIISINAQDTFSRLFAGGLAMNFFIAVLVNIGMVTGLLPVVGIPLPLISYGGTTLVTLLASFGMMMSIQTHRKLIDS